MADSTVKLQRDRNERVRDLVATIRAVTEAKQLENMDELAEGARGLLLRELEGELKPMANEQGRWATKNKK